MSPKRAKPLESLPQNLDVERAVLGYYMAGGAWREDVTGHDFCAEREQIVWQGMKAIHDASDGIDRQRLTVELGEKKLKHIGIRYLADLGEGCYPEMRIEPYIRKLHDATVRRDLLHHTDILTTHIHLGDRTADELIEMGAEAFAGLSRSRNHKEPPTSVPQWPDPLHGEAFHGVVGEVVRVLEPHSEADPVALLMQFLVVWGNMVGRAAYYLVEADYHYSNEYCVLVGASSKARKGTSYGRVEGIFGIIDPHWLGNCLLEGIGSGEALIDSVGGDDKRVLVNEGEFARLLAIINREGSTISANLRTAWDKGRLSIRTRQNRVSVTGAHVSLIGHITRDELLRRIDATEVANGFANRISWACVKRSKKLPHGGGSVDLAPIGRRISEITNHARRMGNTRMEFDPKARLLWEQVYDELSEGKPGMLGAITNRAEAHVVRFALVYALLDCAQKIGVVHLRAALALWRYCEASARYIWGDALGDPTADGLLRALKAAGAEGMTRWDITNHFGRNKSAAELDRAIGVLIERGLIRFAKEDSGGRPTVRYWSL